MKLTPNPAFNGKAQSVGGYIDDRSSPYICPLVGLEMNDRSKFCFLWKCGCVVSERGLKLGADNKCVNCVMEYEEDDIVILNPTEDDITLMKTRLTNRKDKIKNKKNKIKQENMIKEEPVDKDIDVKPVIIDGVTVKTENISVTKEIKTEKNDFKSISNVKNEHTKRKLIKKYIYISPLK